MVAQQHKIESRNSVQNLSCKSCHGTFLIPKLRQNRLLAEICACHASKLQTEHTADLESQRKDSLTRSKRTVEGASSLSASENVAPKNPLSDTNYKAVLKVRGEISAGKSIEEIAQNKKHLDALQASLLQLEEYETACKEFEIQSQRSSVKNESRIESAQVESSKAWDCNAELQNQTAALNLKIRMIIKAQLDCYELPQGIKSLPKNVQTWLKNLKTNEAKCLFLYGPPGTGKTTLASCAVFYAIISGDVTEALFLGSDEVMAVKKDALTVSFKARDSEQVRYQWNDIYNILLKMPLLILDDLGSQKATESTICAYTEIVNARHKTGLPTIYTSNHWAGGGLDDRELAEMIGERAADRVLGSIQCGMDGPSKRQSIRPEEAAVEELFECEKVDAEIQNKFQIKNVPKGDSSCMAWLAQNPVFQVVSDQERRRLTDAEGADIDVPKRSFQGVVNPDDSLTVWGPVLGMEDQLTYFALIEILTDRYRAGSMGTSFQTTLTEISQKLGIREDGAKKNHMLLSRLERLKRASIKYVGGDKKMFLGSFIDTIVYDGKNRSHKITIALNATMIKFYDAGAFFRIRIDELKKMSDWERVLHLFVESNLEDQIKLPLLKFASLAGKENYDRKQLAKNARAAVSQQIKMGYQAPESKVSAGNIHCIRTKRGT